MDCEVGFTSLAAIKFTQSAFSRMKLEKRRSFVPTCAVETLIETLIETLVETLVTTLVEIFVETLIETLVETFVTTLVEIFVETLIETLVETFVETLVETLAASICKGQRSVNCNFHPPPLLMPSPHFLPKHKGKAHFQCHMM